MSVTRTIRLPRAFHMGFAVCLALATAQLARAATLDGDTVSVNAAGLDLASPVGQAMLQKRIETAARAVCGLPFAGQMRSFRDTAECRASAIADAQPKAQALIAQASTRSNVASVAPSR